MKVRSCVTDSDETIALLRSGLKRIVAAKNTEIRNYVAVYPSKY